MSTISKIPISGPPATFYALSIGQSSGFTGLNLTHTYNNRLQPNEFKASSSGGNAIDITYNFVDPSTNKNAGHIYGITNNLDSTRSQTFTYDQLNRITAAQTTSTYSTSPPHCWGETYTLDAWANLNSIAATTNSAYTGCSQESGFATAADGNNHLPVWGYDPSGNATSDATYSYTWDAESQLKAAAGITYLYDGDGRRVSKSNGSVSKLYWYGSGGEVLSETDGAGNMTHEYIFFAGKRIAMTDGGSPDLYVEDMLGTSRVMTWSNGALCYDADFYPYGGERAYTNVCTQEYKFEGKERDPETGNDDFGARYYSNRFGRWLSADWSSVPVPVPYANPTNPQTLNLYSMVADDPESFADLDGHNAMGLPSGSPMTFDKTPSPLQNLEDELEAEHSAQVDAENAAQTAAAQAPPTPAKDQNAQQAQETSPANMTTGQFLKEEVKGVADATITPLVNIAEHPIDTIKQAFEGFSLLATSPVSTIKEAGSQAITEIKQTVSSALDGNPRAIGQVVGTAAALAYTANNVKVQAYPRAGGAGLNILDTPTRGSRIGLDVHRIPEANGGIRPHIDITIKKPGVPSGPGSNLINIKHFPF